MDESYKYFLHTTGKSFGSQPTFVPGGKVPAQGFSSLYGVTKETAEAIVQAGTTRLFKGVVWSERLWIDMDSYEAAEPTERRLVEMGLDFVSYDSGGKGAHFGILRLHPPSHLLPYKDKQWVKENFPNADPSIYTHLHLFRNVGCVHEKTGRKKELVSTQEGAALELPELKESTSYTEVIERRDQESVFECYRVMAECVPQTNGQRHASLVRLAYALRDEAKLDAKMASWWLGEVNKLYEQPKGSDEIEKIIRSIFY